jgi:hypothetical protein
MRQHDWRVMAILILAAVCLRVPCVGASAGDDVARTAIQQFVRGDTPAAIRLLDPTTLPPKAESVAREIHELLARAGSDPAVNRVNWSYFSSFKRDWQKEESVYHVVGPEAAALVFVTAETSAGRTLLTRFHCEPSPRNLMDRYPFIWFGVSVAHYLFLGATAVVVGLIATASVVCIRRGGRRKWLWLAFILIGFGKMSLYWMPGPFSWAMARIQVVSINLLGVGIVKYPLYDPWALSLSIPLGAIIFLARQRLRSANVAAAEQGHEADQR